MQEPGDPQSIVEHDQSSQDFLFLLVWDYVSLPGQQRAPGRLSVFLGLRWEA